MTVEHPPRYLPYEPPLPPPPPDPRRRRVMIAIVAAWALVLLAGAVWYAFHGRPSIREQTTIAQAQSTVDRAVGEVIGAAGPGVVPALSGYERQETCQITPVRAGARYDRKVWLATAPGSEPALLDRIAAGLPAGYHPIAVHASAGGTQTHRLSADAGDYVEITGAVDRAGLVLVTASTGCRPPGHEPAADPVTAPPAEDRAEVDQVLSELGIGADGWSTHQLPCGIRTIEAVGAAGRGLDVLPSPGPLVSGDEVYARAPGLLARIDGDRVTVTLTSGTCR